MSLSSVPSSRLSRSHPRVRRACRQRPLVVEPLEGRLVMSSAWVQQGPGQIVDPFAGTPGQSSNVEGITSPEGPIPESGAIQAIAVQTADTVYVGTVNGGVWKTTNATDASPTWIPLTDSQLPALSINSLAISPLDPNVIFAGG